MNFFSSSLPPILRAIFENLESDVTTQILSKATLHPQNTILTPKYIG